MNLEFVALNCLRLQTPFLGCLGEERANAQLYEFDSEEVGDDVGGKRTGKLEAQRRAWGIMREGAR